MVGSVFRVNQARGVISLSARGEINRAAGAAAAAVRMKTRRSVSQIYRASFAAQMRASAHRVDLYA